jgi:hypothetical protein
LTPGRDCIVNTKYRLSPALCSFKKSLDYLLVVFTKTKKAFIEFRPSGNSFLFEVYNDREEGKKQVCSQGKTFCAANQDAELETDYSDIKGIQGRCSKVMNSTEAQAII